MLVLLLMPTCLLMAFEVRGIDLRWGHFFTFNEYDGQGSEGAPIDMFAGLALPFAFTAVPIEISIAADVSYREYLVTSDMLVVPTQIETGAAAGVGVGGALGVFLRLPTAFAYRPTTDVVLSVGVSPTFLLRLPVRQIEGDIGGMGRYFLESGRYFFPELQLSAFYDYSPRWSFGFTARWLVPIVHLFRTLPLPFPDQMMIGGNVAIRRRFGRS